MFLRQMTILRNPLERGVFQKRTNLKKWYGRRFSEFQEGFIISVPVETKVKIDDFCAPFGCAAFVLWAFRDSSLYGFCRICSVLKLANTEPAWHRF